MMPESKIRHFLREKETTQLLDELSEKLNINIEQLLGTKTNVEVSQTQTAIIYFINGRPLLAAWKNVLVPTLFFHEALRMLPKILVNMGAVPYVCNGADIMAPGAVRIDKDYKQDDYVVVTDERHEKPIAVAVALTDSITARTLKHGKIAKNLHYVGDDLWNQLRRLSP